MNKNLNAEGVSLKVKPSASMLNYMDMRVLRVVHMLSTINSVCYAVDMDTVDMIHCGEPPRRHDNWIEVAF